MWLWLCNGDSGVGGSAEVVAVGCNNGGSRDVGGAEVVADAKGYSCVGENTEVVAVVAAIREAAETVEPHMRLCLRMCLR